MILGPIEVRWIGFGRVSAPLKREIRRLCDNDKRFEAIKRYRAATGATLKDAATEVKRIAP